MEIIPKPILAQCDGIYRINSLCLFWLILLFRYVRIREDKQHIHNLLVGYGFAAVGFIIVCFTVVVIAYFGNSLGFLGYLSFYIVAPCFRFIMKKIDKTESFDGEDSSKPKKVESTIPKERIITFTDGIFAISITLIVVNLRSPESDTDDVQEFDEALLNMWPQFVSFFFSFAIMGVFWYWHHRIFSVIKEVSLVIYRLNIFFLVTLGTIPGLY